MNVRNMLFRIIEAQQSGVQISLAEASAIKLLLTGRHRCRDGGRAVVRQQRLHDRVPGGTQLARDAKSLMIYAGSSGSRSPVAGASRRIAPPSPVRRSTYAAQMWTNTHGRGQLRCVRAHSDQRQMAAAA